MVSISLPALALLILGFSYESHASPRTSFASRRGTVSLLERGLPEFVDCTDDQRKQIEGAIEDLSGLTAHAVEIVDNKDGPWKNNKGYTHYFNEDDHDMVSKGFRASLSAAIVPEAGVHYKIRCGKIADDDCTKEDHAWTDPTPEDFEGGTHKKGVRFVTICPAFFDDDSTKRRLPGDDKKALEEYCKYKESKKYRQFEAGASILLHEITHLDTFGRIAEYPEETQPAQGKTPEYKYHGTIDWKNKFDPANARLLKTSKAKNKPHTWQNAESIAASALEMYAMEACQLDHVDL